MHAKNSISFVCWLWLALTGYSTVQAQLRLQYPVEPVSTPSVLEGWAAWYRELSEVRPFITDDARVVGHRLAQFESWARLDRGSIEHWVLTAYGPRPWLELTAGGVWGAEITPGQWEASFALPLVQAKFLLKPYGHGKPPGFAAVVGSFFPWGLGGFRPEGYGSFGFLTVSQCFGKQENLLLHANLGTNYLHVAGENEWLLTWGFGIQARTYKGFHLVGEIFSGDPYIPGSGTAWQAGFRHFISEFLQVDMTLGKGISGNPPMELWGTAGVRWVIRWFEKTVPGGAQ
jgi:hypothetical protein